MGDVAAEAQQGEGVSKAIVGAVVSPRGETALVTEADLDEKIGEARELQVAGLKSLHRNLWELGKVLGEIETRRLWVQRRAKDGKLRYKGFNACVATELNISSSYAAKLILAAKESSEKELETFGISKCYMVATAPEHARPLLQAKMVDGASKSELATEVTKAKAGG